VGSLFEGLRIMMMLLLVRMLLLVGLVLGLRCQSLAVAEDSPSGPFLPYKPPSAPAPTGKEALQATGSKLKQFFGIDKSTPSAETPEGEAKPAEKQAPAAKPAFISIPEPNLQTVPELQNALDDEAPLPVLKKVDDPNNSLGLLWASQKLKAAQTLGQKNQWAQAETELNILRPWLEEATELHISLFKVLTRVPSGKLQGEFEKRLALEFAKLRDQSILLHAYSRQKTGKLRKAVPDFVSVVQSQSRTKLGLEAYQALQEMGFTEELQLVPTVAPATP
jgi:hypothetical protein